MSKKKNKYAAEAKAARLANERLRMCESKQPFDTEHQAAIANQRSYRCPYCDKWHRSGSFTTLVRTLQKRAERGDA